MANLFSLIFVGKMRVFVSRPMDFVTFLRKNGDLPKRVVYFLRERDTFRSKLMDIVEDFACESNCFHFLYVSSFFSIFEVFFFFFFPSFLFFRFFIFFIFSFFLFFDFFSSSLFFLNFLNFFIVLHVLHF